MDHWAVHYVFVTPRYCHIPEFDHRRIQLLEYLVLLFVFWIGAGPDASCNCVAVVVADD